MKTFNIKKILTRFLIVFSLLVLYVYLCSIIYTPSKIILLEGEKLNLKVAKGITVTTNGNIEGKKKDTQVASNINQKNFPSCIWKPPFQSEYIIPQILKKSM